MAIKMVREPSETPNINNIDDIIPMRYAYGNQNGYVIGKGTEISNTVNGLNFTINSGRLVLQGVECDIDAVGVTLTIDNISTKRYYVVYLQVNLGTNTASILSTYDTATYPTINSGDDLTENATGVARLPLYRFTATNGVISDINKLIESIKYDKDVVVENSKTVNGVDLKYINNQNTNNLVVNNDEVLYRRKNIWTGNILIPFQPMASSTATEINIDYPLNDKQKIIIRYSDNTDDLYEEKQVTIPLTSDLKTSYNVMLYSTNVIVQNYCFLISVSCGLKNQGGNNSNTLLFINAWTKYSNSLDPPSDFGSFYIKSIDLVL